MKNSALFSRVMSLVGSCLIFIISILCVAFFTVAIDEMLFNLKHFIHADSVILMLFGSFLCCLAAIVSMLYIGRTIFIILNEHTNKN